MHFHRQRYVQFLRMIKHMLYARIGLLSYFRIAEQAVDDVTNTEEGRGEQSGEAATT